MEVIKPVKTNDEKVKEYKKRYYQEHRDVIIMKMTREHICDVCGRTYLHVNKSKHNRTLKHMLAELKKNNN